MYDPTLSMFEAINSNEPEWAPGNYRGLDLPAAGRGEMGNLSFWNDSLFGLHLARVFSLVGACPARSCGRAMPKSNPCGAFKYFIKNDIFSIASPAGRFFFAPRSKKKPKNPSSIVIFIFIGNRYSLNWLLIKRYYNRPFCNIMIE